MKYQRLAQIAEHDVNAHVVEEVQDVEFGVIVMIHGASGIQLLPEGRILHLCGELVLDETYAALHFCRIP